MPIERNRIVKRYLILCEGKDAEGFLISYLNSDALRFDPRFSEEIQVLDFGGIGQLSSYLLNLQNLDGFEKVKSVFVLRDSETDAAAGVNSVMKGFEVSGLPVPRSCCVWNHEGEPATAFALLPSCDSTPVDGTLEDLCWQILAGDDSAVVSDKAKRFIEDIKASHPERIVSHEHKSRLHAYFSTSDRLVSMKIGEAAKAGAFDWNSKQLAPLRDVLVEGFVSLK